MSKEESENKKQGGARPGSGRKKGSGIPSENLVIRMPKGVKAEAKRKGVKNLTKFIVEGTKKRLNALPDPESKTTAKKEAKAKK